MIEELKNIQILEETPHRVSFEMQPLNPGFGITIGNSLRRVLLSSLGGYCISAVHLEGISHEFSTIDGVLEDVTEIILNLKKVRFKKQTELKNDTFVYKASIKDKEVITAGDLAMFIDDFQILNPDLVICNKDESTLFNLSLLIKRGVGYVPAEEQEFDPNLTTDLGLENNFIKIDGVYSPIKSIDYKIENQRVGKRTDYEKLVLDLVTDGSIAPMDAMGEAAKILTDHFGLFLDQDANKKEEKLDTKKEKVQEIKPNQSLLNKSIDELGLGARAVNGLIYESIKTLGQLVIHSEEEVIKFKNIGKKCMKEINDKLKERGLYLGMDLKSLGNE